MKDFKLFWGSWIKSLIINLATSSIWFGLEYIQFKELQWNRECDNVVGFIYFCIIWYLIYKREKEKNKYIDEIINLCKKGDSNER